MADDNIVKLPDTLERRALKIEAAIERQGKHDAGWVDATLELAVELAAAREDLASNQAFSKWCEGRLHNIMKTPNERAILIQWGKDPVQARILLEKRETNSIQMIHRGFRNPAKTPPPPTPAAPLPGSTPAREVAKATIRAHKEIHGVFPSVIEAQKETGKSRIVVEPALASVIAESSAAPPSPAFTKAQEYHIEAQVKARLYERDRERAKQFDARVTAENKRQIDILFPDLEKLRKEAAINEQYYREMTSKLAIFTEEEYRTILFCLHPDNVASKEKRETAFKAFQASKVRLTGRA